jgi:hypothetical protein
MAVAHGISFQWLWCQKNRKYIRNIHIIAQLVVFVKLNFAVNTSNLW